MKYRKRPVEIEAFRYGDLSPKWFFEAAESGKVRCFNEFCLIETLEGTMKCPRGTYVIKGIEGELYPCKPSIFEQTYEVVT